MRLEFKILVFLAVIALAPNLLSASALAQEAEADKKDRTEVAKNVFDEGVERPPSSFADLVENLFPSRCEYFLDPGNWRGSRFS